MRGGGGGWGGREGEERLGGWMVRVAAASANSVDSHFGTRGRFNSSANKQDKHGIERPSYLPYRSL